MSAVSTSASIRAWSGVRLDESVVIHSSSSSVSRFFCRDSVKLAHARTEAEALLALPGGGELYADAALRLGAVLGHQGRTAECARSETRRSDFTCIENGAP